MLDYTYEDNNTNNIGIPRAQKYSIDYLNIFSIGDINNDTDKKVIDAVIMVNHILMNSYNFLGDMNTDNLLNVLDILILVNFIINN